MVEMNDFSKIIIVNLLNINKLTGATGANGTKKCWNGTIKVSQ